MADWSVGGKTARGGISLVSVGDGPNLDSFGRIRTGEPISIFESRFQYHLHPLFFDSTTANGATITHTAAISSATMALDGTASGSAVLQSKQYSIYTPGKSQLIAMTFVMGSATATVVKRVGYFDANDGLFVEQNGTTDVAFVRRTSTSGSPVDNRVTQANWNVDTLDGSGDKSNPSGLTLDLSKGQILDIDFQWLGYGRARMGFNIDGESVTCHEFLNANVLSVPFMKTGNLPVRWEISGDAADSLIATCSTVQSEGGTKDLGFGHQISYDRASVTAGNGTQVYAFSIRPKTTYNSVANRMLIRPLQWRCLVTGNSPVLTEIYYGTTVGGTPSWADMNTTHSGLQVDTAGTPSGGVKVNSFWTAASAVNTAQADIRETAHHPLALDIAGTGYNHMTVYVTGATATSACRPGLLWEEIR